MPRIARPKTRVRRRWDPYYIPPQKIPGILRNLAYYRRQVMRPPARAVRLGRPGVSPAPLPRGATYTYPSGGRDRPVFTTRGPDRAPRISFGDFVRHPYPWVPVPQRPHAPVPPSVARVRAAQLPRFRDMQPYKLQSRPDRGGPRRQRPYQTWRKYAALCLIGILQLMYSSRQLAYRGDAPNLATKSRRPTGSNAVNAKTVKQVASHFRDANNLTKKSSGHFLIRPLCWFQSMGRSYIPACFRQLPSRRPVQPQPTVSALRQQNLVAGPTPVKQLCRERHLYATGATGQPTPICSLSQYAYPQRGGATFVQQWIPPQPILSPVRRIPPFSPFPARYPNDPSERSLIEDTLADLLNDKMGGFLDESPSSPDAPQVGGSRARRAAPPESSTHKRPKSPPVPARPPQPVGGKRGEPSRRARRGQRAPPGRSPMRSLPLTYCPIESRVPTLGLHNLQDPSPGEAAVQSEEEHGAGEVAGLAAAAATPAAAAGHSAGPASRKVLVKVYEPFRQSETTLLYCPSDEELKEEKDDIYVLNNKITRKFKTIESITDYMCGISNTNEDSEEVAVNTKREMEENRDACSNNEDLNKDTGGGKRRRRRRRRRGKDPEQQE